MSVARILISRTDRAGDVVLTLPLFNALRKAWSDSLLIAHVRPYTAPLVHLNPCVDQVLARQRPTSMGEILALSKTLRRLRLTHAVVVHPDPLTLLAVRLAGVPVRVGRASNIGQIFLSHGLRQHRSRNEQHECRYNLDLLEPLIGATPDILPEIVPSPAHRQYGANILDALGLAGLAPIMIHPGDGGSADNLSLDSYLALTTHLCRMALPVLISLGPAETDLFHVFAERFGNHSAIAGEHRSAGKVAILRNVPDLAHLAGVLQHVCAFVGGSTGPMHLAAILGKPVVAFFPPKPAMTPRRWGPLAPDPRQLLIVSPVVAKCSSNCATCPYAPCMDAINLSEAAEWLKDKAKEQPPASSVT